jgi:hypothetical protein
MIGLDRPARDPLAVSDPVDALLTLGTEIKMILQQDAQQLPPVTGKARLQIRMLNAIRSLATEPIEDHSELLARASKRVPGLAVLIVSKIRCITHSHRYGQQDFINRRVNIAVTGAEIGDHVGHPFSWSTLVLATPTFGTRSTFSYRPTAAPPTETGCKRAPTTVASPRIMNKSGTSPSLYGSRTHRFSRNAIVRQSLRRRSDPLRRQAWGARLEPCEVLAGTRPFS